MIRDTSAMDRPVDGASARSSRARRLLVPVVALGLAAGGAAAFLPIIRSWSESQASIEASRLRLGRVVRGDLVRDVHVPGRLVSASHPTLFAVAAGIVSLRVRPGALVDQGQVLAVVESPKLDSELKIARAKLDSLLFDFERQKIVNQQQSLTDKQKAEMARVSFKAADRELQRAKRTFADKLTNEYELSKARDEWARAKLELDHARETIVQHRKTRRFELKDRERRVEQQRLVVAEIERRIGDLTIRSPVDGLVGEVFVEDRDAVAEQGPVVKVVDLSVFEIDVEIPEAYADEVYVRAPAEIKVGTGTAAGMITRVSPSVTAGRVSGTASFVEAPPDGLRQNQRVDVRVVLERRAGVVKAPRGAYADAGGRFVYVVRDRMAYRTAIEMGARGIRECEIRSGLEPGDEIVLSDMSDLDDAETVLLY